eukprot:CAMPEP_0195508130 /NCGR_PEP_ID=MMETSP0794_2-20130614/1431_1 /TAXON_ID=515487 /ORGANISM="Stephanopyxis turris, Strain CCMP 815" /LENGTH=66 /DNA_ID=CAMNT_0040635017 /DNA_START=9 /DNA_END=206 /DNA_ORIENTATION=+
MDADVAVEARPPRRRLWHHTGGDATAGVREMIIHGQKNAHGQVAMDADVAVEARPPRRRLWHHTGG